MEFRRFHRFVISFLLLLVFAGPLVAPYAAAFSFPDRYDMVAILVEQGLYADTTDYGGLAPKHGGVLRNTTLKERIDRYAIDLQNALPGTRAVIIQVDRFEKPENVTSVLERLYFDGDPKEPNRTAYLRGLVIVGEVPLPVVNKKGQRFISLFPYTDFEQKAYLWNAQTRDFELSEDNPSPHPEIWHGVIRPPVSTEMQEGKELLTSYFDKNHLYHRGDPQYAVFDKKIFFQDFFHERKNLNPTAYKNYLNFLNHQGDIAYSRYTKELFADLAGPMEKEIAQDEQEAKALIKELADAGIPSDASVPQPELSADAPQEAKDAIKNQNKKPADKAAIPDIMTKISKMSDNLMFRFYQVFTKYPSLVNDFAKYTGRYTPADVDSAVNLITAKDTFTLAYLKAVNSMIEGKIDEMVMKLQKNIAIGEARIAVNKAWRKTDAGNIEIPHLPPVANSLPRLYINFSEERHGLPERLNGNPLGALKSVAECASIFGSRGTGAYSQAVELNRAFDIQTATDRDGETVRGRTPNEKDAGYRCNLGRANCEGYKHFAGCFYDGSKLAETPQDPFPQGQICFPNYASDSVTDRAGAREVAGPLPSSFDTFQACLNFQEKEIQGAYLDSIQKRLDALDDNYNKNREEKIAILRQHPIVPVEQHPDSIPLFVFDAGVDSFTVTLGDMLRAFGWNQGASPSGWKEKLSELILNPVGTVVIGINHEKVSAVEFSLEFSAKKEISSIFYHKEPTAETRNAQAENLMSQDLPVDNPRYVTFQDKTGAVRRITYPDLFTAKSFDEYIDALKKIEEYLNVTPRDPNTSLPCAGCLTSLISDLAENAAPVAGETVISRANRSKLFDALAWKELDIDSKHTYLNEYYLDPVKNAFVGEPTSGYEMLYMNGEGNSFGYDFSLHALPSQETDPVFAAAQKEAARLLEEKEAAYDDDPKNPFDSQLPPAEGEEGSYDLIKFSPPPLSPWWEKMKEWFENLKAETNKFSFGTSEEEFYNKQEEQNKKELERIEQERIEIELKPAAADEVNLSKIAAVELSADATTVVGGKRAAVFVTLKDKEGKIVNDEFAKLTLALSGDGVFASDVPDDNPETPEKEITLLSGRYEIGLIAAEKGEKMSLTATLQEGVPEDGASAWKKAEISLTVLEEAKLLLEASRLAVIADGQNQIAVTVSAVDLTGRLLSGVNGKISVAVSDPRMVAIQEKEIRLASGQSTFHLLVGKKAGPLGINASMSSLDSGQLTLTLLPGPPTHVVLSAEDEKLPIAPGSSLTLRALLFDAFGNPVTTKSGTEINFRISDATKRFATLSSASEIVKDGQAEVNVLPTEESGTVHVIAESPDLAPGVFSLRTVKQWTSSTLKTLQPNVLVGALLGISGGDVTEPDYFGGWLLMNGKTQAATTLTAPPKLFQKLFGVNENGGVSFADSERITAHFLPANNFTLVFKDEQLQQDLAQLTLVATKDSAFEVTKAFDPETLTDGIYMKKTNDDEVYAVDRKKGALRLVKADSEKVEVQTNGFLRIFDNEFSVRPVPGKFLTMEILDKDTPVAEIFFVQRFSQSVVRSEVASAPGVYIKTFPSSPTITTGSIFTGNSSNAPTGFAVFDRTQTVSGPGAPGFAFQSLEDSLDRMGVGFTEDNKFALLFSAGESFGEANRPYASDVGIVLGDPTIKINNESPGGFSQDVGKLIYSGSAEVFGLLGLDYNSDGFEDVLIVEDGGKVRLLQNNGGYDQLKDQGFILDIKNGIQDFTKADFNNDQQMDLVFAVKESCRKGDTCIDVYENHDGAFTRKNLRFKQDDKVVTLRSFDLNHDSFTDLIFADSSGSIKILYNRAGQFDGEPQFVGNVGLSVDPAKNLIKSVLIHYAGIPTKNPTDPISAQSYETVSEKDFMYADLDKTAFSASTKFAEDLNGGIVKSGDQIRYRITLKNNSPAAKTDVSISDVIADQVELNPASIKCADCAPNELQITALNGEHTRPLLFHGLRIPAGASRTIVYEATFTGETAVSDKIILAFNNRFTDSNPVLAARLTQDEYPDISVSKESNSTGRVRYFYTTGIAADKTPLWESELSSPPAPLTARDLKAKTGLDIPTSTAEATATARDRLNNLKKEDSDGDGTVDSVDSVDGLLDDIAGTTKAITDKATCDAGCIAMPFNLALLAPGFYNVLGIPSGYDQGTPMVGFTLPNPPYVGAGTPALAGTTGRFYVAPTLTGGVGFAYCMSTYGTSKNCYSFGINPLDMLPGNICDKLNKAISEALASANSVVSSANEGTVLTLRGASGTTDTEGRRATGSGLGNYSLGNYDSPVSKSRNIRTPGFPSVITDWWARQMEELSDKGLNIPDIYLIYPEGSSIIGAFKPTQKFNKSGNLLTNILAYLNSIPIIDIESKEVLFKVPVVTRHEIEKFKTDARQWIEDERLELDKWRQTMGCAGATNDIKKVADPDVCRFVTLEMNNLINGVSENMKALDEWILFPKKLAQYRAVESYYLTQIIDYLDTIIQFSGGWVKKNMARIKEWKRAIRQMKQSIGTYKAVADLMIEYNESCDKCKTERYTLKDLILKLFIAIPSPPVIPIPKLPDIVIDVSKIRAGLRIYWPDIKFMPQPLVLPKLPRFALGVNLNVPQFKAMLPGVTIPAIPKPPELPQLPALPQLNVPKLPDIPPPPKLPGLPKQLVTLTSVLKKIVKILCIIRMGFTPTDETLLKARIEEITARGLGPVLPIDTMFTVQSPTISVTYVDQLLITAYTNLQLDLKFIQEKVEEVAEKVNSFSTSFSKNANSFTTNLGKQLEKVTTPTLPLAPSGPEGRQLNYRPNSKEKSQERNLLTQELSRALGVDATSLVENGYEMRELVASLEKTSQEYQEIKNAVPDEYTLTVSTVPFTPHLQKESTDLIVLPFQGRLKEYRDHLAAYLSDYENQIARGPIGEEFDEFTRIIASQRSPFADQNLKRFIAADNFNFSAGSGGAAEKINWGPLDLETADWISEEELGDALRTDKKRLLAYDFKIPPEIPTPDGAAGFGGPSGFGDIEDIGIFIIDPFGLSKRLINYTLEANSENHLADIAIDADADLDKLYSYGSDVFLKKNARIQEAEKQTVFRDVDIEMWTVSELLPSAWAPDTLKVSTETVKQTRFNFRNSTFGGDEADKDIAGFEVITRHSPFFFESSTAASKHRTLRFHLIPDAEETSGTAAGAPEADRSIEVVDPDGTISINGEKLTSNQLASGDYIETGQESSVTLRARDGTVFRLSELTGIAPTIGGPFQLSKGIVEIDIPRAGSEFLPYGTNVSVKSEAPMDSQIRLRFFDGSEVKVSKGASFTLPEIEQVTGVLKTISGMATFTGAKREYIRSQNGKVHLEAGESLHPLEITKIKWNAENPGERSITVSKDITVTVPAVFSTGIDLEIESGVAEIIRSEKATQSASQGMGLMPGDKIEMQKGSAGISYPRGGETTLFFNETFVLQEIEDMKNPTASLEVPEGFYFAKVRSFDSGGRRSTSSERLLLAPQVCSDQTPPVAQANTTKLTVAMGKTKTLDARRSFDTESKIISYQFADGPETTSPEFIIGPFADVGKRTMRLTVKDEAGNEGYQDVIIEVVTPRIVLDEVQLRSNVIGGFVEPAEQNVPITLARLRPSEGTQTQGWQILKTPSASPEGQYSTDAAGKFSVNDLDLRDRLIVKNSEGMTVAEIHRKTGRITITDESYETRLLPLSTENASLRIGIFKKRENQALTFVYFVPDSNTDTKIDSEKVSYDENAFIVLSGVHIKPLPKALEKGIRFSIIPGNDPAVPGATAIQKGQTRLAAIDVNGDVIIPQGQIAVREKFFPPEFLKQAPNQPVVFELLYENEAVAELFIAAQTASRSGISVVDQASPPPRPKIARPRVTQPFTDISNADPFAETIEKLYRLGIVAGYPSTVKEQLLFKPENQINRAEFTQITLKMLCIVPRPEARELPSPFYDVLDPKLWFYPVLKEGNIRGFVDGYIGEMQIDTAGVATTPFKPAHNITRAEAATVVLAALYEQDIIDLSTIDFTAPAGQPWYVRYVEVAQDLTPYLKNPEDKSKRAFLITTEEASRPDEPISRRDFAVMAERVLLIYDCYDIPPEADPYTDREQAPREEIRNIEGIFVVRPACNVCPCFATLTEGADLRPGDIIFAAVTGPNGIPIYAKSNELTF